MTLLFTNSMYSSRVQTTNLIINLDHDEWILDDDEKILADAGFGKPCISFSIPCLINPTENETEVSFFNRQLYEQFKQNPEVRFLSVPHSFTDLILAPSDEMGLICLQVSGFERAVYGHSQLVQYHRALSRCDLSYRLPHKNEYLLQALVS